MGFLNKVFGRKTRDRRITARFRVKIGQSDSAYWTEDVAIGGIRMYIGKKLSLGDLTGGSRDVPLSIELDSGTVVVYGEPIRTVRTEDGQLATGWMFSRFQADGKERLQTYIDSAE